VALRPARITLLYLYATNMGTNSFNPTPAFRPSTNHVAIRHHVLLIDSTLTLTLITRHLY
jgi:hypothetical protein